MPVARVELAPVTVIPDIVAAKALEYAGDAESPIEQLRAIELKLQSTGFFSRGTASDSAPSVAGHGADRITDLFTGDVMVGDEEQYASAFALMARSLGYPARVVMGFAPEVRDGGGAVEVTGHDVTAWVEVAFEGVGWVPFSPTPDQTDVPQDQNPKPKTEPQPQVRQPPRSSNDQDLPGHGGRDRRRRFGRRGRVPHPGVADRGRPVASHPGRARVPSDADHRRRQAGAGASTPRGPRAARGGARCVG